ncbi:hypothetical protein [Grimontia hollisae]|uniref:hypothetical protein n=1 Tax=Grimontia hollisae TaxID=673 RepID=UPI000DFC9F02|nr:hypothetical protein [Grimontia hollisae]MDF2183862.1 hypothetical protein [Grimontia hollisae]STQ77763.1 Uncharacterised protein [Grimontia hollisae]
MRSLIICSFLSDFEHLFLDVELDVEKGVKNPKEKADSELTAWPNPASLGILQGRYDLCQLNTTILNKNCAISYF